jgi:effector-binding domain-containing protein
MARMTAEPEIVERAAQPWLAIAGSVTMTTMLEIIDRCPEVFAFLDAHGIAPAGPVVFQYDHVDMDSRLDMRVGVPTAEPVEGEGDVQPGVLPAGRYLTVTHVGHPDTLVDATGELLAWADARGLKFDRDGDDWASRLEIYLSDPVEQPDMTKWETVLAFKLRD